jgi:DNA-binding LacI/PurR family transcriptional regulator
MLSWTLVTMRRLSEQVLKDAAVVCLQKPEWANSASVTLSYVEQPMREMAEMAWRTLLERIENPEATTKTLLLRAKVVMDPALRAVDQRATSQLGDKLG